MQRREVPARVGEAVPYRAVSAASRAPSVTAVVPQQRAPDRTVTVVDALPVGVTGVVIAAAERSRRTGRAGPSQSASRDRPEAVQAR